MRKEKAIYDSEKKIVMNMADKMMIRHQNFTLN